MPRTQCLAAGNIHPMAKKSATAIPDGELPDLSFEQAFADLEGIVEKLESGELPLEEALALHERGKQLADHLNALLERAELKVQTVDIAATPD